MNVSVCYGLFGNKASEASDVIFPDSPFDFSGRTGAWEKADRISGKVSVIFMQSVC